MNLRIKRELTKQLLQALADRGLQTDRKAAAEEISGLMDRLDPLFPLADRFSCAEVAEACAPMLGEAPERGWNAFTYDYLRERMFPNRNLTGMPLCSVRT